MNILYLHGLGSKPGGVKPNFLRRSGHEVSNPYLPDDNFRLSVQHAQEALLTAHPDVVVGSSRGGAVALAIETGDVPRVLIAPAWKRWGEAIRADGPMIVLHSARDEVVPFAWSVELIANSGLTASCLKDVGIDHAMVDDEALQALLDALAEVTRE